MAVGDRKASFSSQSTRKTGKTAQHFIVPLYFYQFLPISTDFYLLYSDITLGFSDLELNKELELVFRLQGFGPCTGGNLRLIRPHSAAAHKRA